jgi:predicted NUDIX family NTP pyrophosphohydrolase
MAKRSAALLLYRLNDDGELEVLVGHMGGPFWAKKDARAWSIPKGEYEDEEPLAAALREFAEEMGEAPPAGDIIELGENKQRSGKIITTYALRGDYDLQKFRSNTFELEWPRGSGRIQEFPEVDRAEWMTIERASDLLVTGQVPILDVLRDRLRAHPGKPG